MEDSQVLAEVERLAKELSATCHGHGMASIISATAHKSGNNIFMIEGPAFDLLAMVAASIGSLIQGSHGKLSYEAVMKIVNAMMNEAHESGLLDEDKDESV